MPAIAGVTKAAAARRPAERSVGLVIRFSNVRKANDHEEAELLIAVQRRVRFPKGSVRTFSPRELRFLRPDTDELFAEIGALEQPDQRLRRAVETLGHELLVFDLALVDPLRHVVQEVAMARGEIADDEAAERQA